MRDTDGLRAMVCGLSKNIELDEARSLGREVCLHADICLTTDSFIQSFTFHNNIVQRGRCYRPRNKPGHLL